MTKPPSAIVDRHALARVLDFAQRGALKHCPRAILTCVRMDFTDKVLRLCSTDGEVCCWATTPYVDIRQHGSVAVPALDLRGIVKEMTDPTVTLEVDDQTLHLKEGTASSTLLGYPVAEFPPLPKPATAFAVNGPVLLEAIDRVLFAAANETSRYAISGINFRYMGAGRMIVEATDGRRLAESTLRVTPDDPKAPKWSAIAPRKALQQLQRALGGKGGPVVVRFGPTHVASTGGKPDSPPTDVASLLFAAERPNGETACVWCQVVEGAFPAVADVWPEGVANRFSVPRKELDQALKAVSRAVTEESRGVRFHVNGVLELTAKSPEKGEASASVPATVLEVEFPAKGIPDIGFQPDFIRDALAVLEDSEIVFGLNASNKPALFTRENWRYLVMPIMLPENRPEPKPAKGKPPAGSPAKAPVVAPPVDRGTDDVRALVARMEADLVCV